MKKYTQKFKFVNINIELEKLPGVFRYPTPQSALKFLLYQEFITVEQVHEVVKAYIAWRAKE